MESGITNLIPVITETPSNENSFSFTKENTYENRRIWTKISEVYRQQNIVNPELRNIITHECGWYEIFHNQIKYEVCKFIWEWIASLFLLVLLLPVFVLIGLCIKLNSSGPVFYKQVRIGYHMKPFRIFKFRTMCKGAEEKIPFLQNEMSGGMFKVLDDPRITLVGRFLRRWSLDELPQLLNVLTGTMSLVGPRPLSIDDTSTVPEQFYIRFAARPGITGLWQALSRDCNDGRVKIMLDADYVKQRSLFLDLKLLLSTIPTVIKGIGAI